MSEFDKWFSADGTLIPQAGDAGYEGYVERRIAWRQALKWAKAMHDVSSEPRFAMNIEKEINDD